MAESFSMDALGDWDFSWRYEVDDENVHSEATEVMQDMSNATRYSASGPLIPVRLPFELPLGGSEFRHMKVRRDRATLAFLGDVDRSELEFV